MSSIQFNSLTPGFLFNALLDIPKVATPENALDSEQTLNFTTSTRSFLHFDLLPRERNLKTTGHTGCSTNLDDPVRLFHIVTLPMLMTPTHAGVGSFRMLSVTPHGGKLSRPWIHSGQSWCAQVQSTRLNLS
uniref:Uncharacterized protein n=1 Tax=Compsopogon caeruleus TaxID=31354 RepID=A0A7S1TF92_9RHOD|mmetsp:Transcript_4415/g.8720  ORF Transcript_4415/g.8720 Transcript_4415/m.8720 type:complete len:132 (+) Transcript_4415:143-538(+)